MASPRATWSSSTAWTGCVPARASKWLRRGPRSSRTPKPRDPAKAPARDSGAGPRADEPVAAFHPEAGRDHAAHGRDCACRRVRVPPAADLGAAAGRLRSEEHTSELQSRENLVCRLLLE